jgi:hypothetical protein
VKCGLRAWLESFFVRVLLTEEKKEEGSQVLSCSQPISAASWVHRPVFGTNNHRNGCTGSVDRRADGGRTDGHKKIYKKSIEAMRRCSGINVLTLFYLQRGRRWFPSLKYSDIIQPLFGNVQKPNHHNKLQLQLQATTTTTTITARHQHPVPQVCLRPYVFIIMHHTPT